MFFDVSAISTLLKFINVDYETLVQLRRFPNIKLCRPGFEIKTQSPIEHE
jgi:hypothetical protein